MAATKSLSALLAQTSLDDHDEVLKSANAAIKKSKADLEAQHAKVVALLKLDRYDDAVKVFKDVPQLQEKARFEYAYALYKSGNAGEAVEVASKDDSTRALKHVLAQAAYRSENFEQAVNVYRELAREKNSDEEADIRINSSAVDAQLEWSGQGHLAQSKKPGREDLLAFETAYNAACGSISRGELAQAEVCLKRARDLCNATTDLTDAEKEAEIIPMTVQQVYILTQLGRIDEAEQLITTIPVAEIKELSTRYIAQDEYVLDLLANKVTGVTASTSKVISTSPAPTISSAVNTASVLNAAAHARNLTEKAALKEILPLLEKRPNDVGLILTITNLYVLTNNYTAATHLLESFFKRLEQSGTSSDLDVRHAPGLIATLVSLYSHQSRHSHSRTELAKAASYWRHKSKTTNRSLLLAAGSALLDTHNPDNVNAAGDIFEKLYAQDHNDKGAIAGLVAAYSLSSPEKLTPELVGVLPQAERLISDIDAAALEDAGVPTLTSTTASSLTTTTTTKRAAPKSAVPATSSAKRLRKSRIPKDYDPNKKVDPERWLPLRDRTYYRPKGKKGKKKLEGLTQGGAVAAEDNGGGGKAQGVDGGAGGGGGGGAGGKKGGKKGKGKGKR